MKTAREFADLVLASWDKDATGLIEADRREVRAAANLAFAKELEGLFETYGSFAVRDRIEREINQ